MANSSESNQSPEPGQDGRSPWGQAAVAIAVAGGVVVVGAGLAVLGARYFVYERLAPIVEEALTTALDRPVELGEVQRFTPVGITFDGAEIPTTDTQTDYAKAAQVQVGFNPVELVVDLLRDREIPITLKLIDSELFLVEEDGWLQTEIQPSEDDEGGPVTVVVQEVVVDNATVIANPKGSLAVNQQLEANDLTDDADDIDIQSTVPIGSEGNNPGERDADDTDAGSIIETEDTDGEPNVQLEPVILEGIDAAAQFENDYKNIAFEARGDIRSGGNFGIDGEANLDTQRINGRVQSQDVAMSNLAALLPLPVAVEQGQLDSNVIIRYAGSESRSPLESLSFQGTAQVIDVVAQLDVAPKPVEDLNARLRFEGQTVRLEDTTLRYDQIPVEAGGSVDLGEGYNIQAQVPQVTLDELQQTLNIPIPVVVAGAFTANANITGPLEQPVVSGDVRSLDQIQVDRTAVDLVEAAFTLTPPLLSVDSFTILPTVGGEIAGQGRVDLEADGGVVADITAVLPGDGLAQDYGFTLPEPYQIGNLVADVEVFGPFDDIQAVAQWQLPQATYSGSGEVRYGDRQLRLQNTQFQVEGGTVNANGVAQLDQQTWQATVGAAGIQTGGVAPQVQGLLNADVALSGRLDQLDLRAINAQGTAQLANANIQPVNGVALVDPGTYETGFRWTGDGIQVEGFRGPGVVADGFIGVDPATEAIVTNFDLDVQARDYEIARLEPFLPPAAQAQAQLRGRATYLGRVSGTLEAPQVDGQLALTDFGVNRFTFANLSGPVNLALGQGGRLDLAGGGDQIAAGIRPDYIPTDFTIENGDASVTGTTRGDIVDADLRNFPLQQLDIAPLGPEAGTVEGIVNADVMANIADLSNPNVMASISVAQPGLGPITGERFSGEVTYRNNTVSLDDGTLAITIAESPPVQRTTDEDLDAEVNTNLCVASQRPDREPEEESVAGAEEESDPAEGSPDNEELPDLRGESLYNISGRLGLSGPQDFAVDIGVQQGQLKTVVAALPLVTSVTSFESASGPATAGREGLQTRAVQIPEPPPKYQIPALPPAERRIPEISSREQQCAFVEKLIGLRNAIEAESVTPIPDLKELSGTYDATLNVSGQLAAIPESVVGDFTLNGEDWRWGQYAGDNRVTVIGQVANATVTFDSANVPDESAPFNSPNSSAPFQALRFEAGETVVAYEGTVGLGTDIPQSGMLTVEQVPVPELQGIAESFVAIPIDLGGTLSASANLNGPLEDPIITDGTATVADISIDGERLDDLTVTFGYNEENDAVLDAEARLANRGPDVFMADARIPYALPLMAAGPEIGEEIEATATLRNEGLALIGLLSGGQVQWEGGEGKVQANVGGTVAQPTIDGEATFTDGTVAIAALNDPITDIEGSAAFDLQRVTVDQINARLNGGEIMIVGDLPIFEPQETQANGAAETASPKPPQLLVTLTEVPVNLDVATVVDLDFSATVDSPEGIAITNAALAPTLGGEVQISDGRVDPIRGFFGGLGLLGGESSERRPDPVPTRVGEEPSRQERFGLENLGGALEQSTPDDNTFASKIGFNDLKVILANDLEIAGQPFFNIEAAGDLTLNGTLANLKPEGTLSLDSGWINIYTTQFRLDRGEDQLVILEPDRGLDPIVRVTAIADVPETQQTPVPPSSPFASSTLFSSSETAAQSSITSFGGFETVEVTVSIDGPLSELQDNLELESQPARSDSQLIALIGGGLVNQLAQGDTALAVAGFVGSGTFASFSNDVVDALGLDLFRIFPTTDVSGDSNLPISIGVEAGIDLTDDFSFTVLQLLGSTSPPQFGVRYRLTDDLQLRANTDLEEDTRGVLEYQIRF